VIHALRLGQDPHCISCCDGCERLAIWPIKDDCLVVKRADGENVVKSIVRSVLHVSTSKYVCLRGMPVILDGRGGNFDLAPLSTWVFIDVPHHE
jgi:hypothetical protein